MSCSTCLPDVLVIALTIWGEARGESLEGKAAVATVLHNRAQHLALPTASALSDNPVALRLAGVCLAPNQFGFWNGGGNPAEKLQRMALQTGMNLKEAMAWHDCYTLAAQLCSGLFEPRGLWTHYHSVKIVPPWVSMLTNPHTIGAHTFWEPKP